MTELVMAAVVTALAVPVALPALRRAGALDVPNARSSHSAPVPRGGGVAIVVGVATATLAGWAGGAQIAWAVVAGGLAMAAVGLRDDVRSMASGVRLALQTTVGVALTVWAWLAVGTAGLPAAAFVVLGVVAVVGYVNAFNFMDGINGISGLNAVVGGGWYAWVGQQYDVPGVAPVALAVAGAAVGFLPWNAPTARVFLGDVGSYGLGSLIAGLALVCWAGGAPMLVCVAPLVVYGADTGTVLAKRAAARQPLMQAHRDHVYQRLVDAGWTHTASAALTAALAVAVVLATASWHRQSALAVAAAMVLAAIAYLVAPHVDAHLRSRKEASA